MEVEQSCTFFNTPREIKDLIYGFVFEGGKSEEGALSPLGSCRLFYIEARDTAWSAVTFRFDWSKISQKYFDGDWIPPRFTESNAPSFQALDWESEARPVPNGPMPVSQLEALPTSLFAQSLPELVSALNKSGLYVEYLWRLILFMPDTTQVTQFSGSYNISFKAFRKHPILQNSIS
ncbi:hypothetical protein K505DRAFT_372167 [Melanomma pulvis-pyrius CBS 109.77]|uniref:Uncharacterized protein n=1 Tax=Melanomma pulvis-pyrius CBS 109.77 TaxID=1314802 RepID=A0A6A6XPH5_9PLEO|nr:hypothetical protein K505DRAFT_372167 [Melanomma pulvis-pyrius CBS 109.77]